MSKNNAIHSDDNPLTDELVVKYLQDNPEFFNRHAALVSELRLADPNRGTVSLVERQQQQMRQKVALLEEEITQLLSTATHNEKLFHRFNQATLALMACTDKQQLLDALAEEVLNIMALDELTIWLTPEKSVEHKSVTQQDCQGVINNRLKEQPYYFGRLQQTEQQRIFGHSCEGSVVLVKLEDDQQTFGLLAFRSNDAEHFDPRMDTLMLNQFTSLVTKLLIRFLA